MGNVELLQAQHGSVAAREVIDRRTPHPANTDHDDVIHGPAVYQPAGRLPLAVPLQLPKPPDSKLSLNSPLTNANSTEDGSPGLNRSNELTIESAGGWSASNQKLNNVAKRRAWAFGLVAKVSVDQVRTLGDEEVVQLSIAYGSPEWCSMPLKPTLVKVVAD